MWIAKQFPLRLSFLFLGLYEMILEKMCIGIFVWDYISRGDDTADKSRRKKAKNSGDYIHRAADAAPMIRVAGVPSITIFFSSKPLRQSL
jgi:hypothetical protein